MVIVDTVGLIGFAWYFSRRYDSLLAKSRDQEASIRDLERRTGENANMTNMSKHQQVETESRLDEVERFMTALGDTNDLVKTLRRVKDQDKRIKELEKDNEHMREALKNAGIACKKPKPVKKQTKRDKKSKKHRSSSSSSSASSSSSSTVSNHDDPEEDPYLIIEKANASAANKKSRY